MIWNKTEVFVTDEWVDVSEYPDINIDIDKDGRVLIQAKKIPLKYVRLISKTDIKEDEILVLSDAWEADAVVLCRIMQRKGVLLRG